MNEGNIFAWIGIGCIAYLVWKHFKGPKGPMLTVMDGGLTGSLRGQFVPTDRGVPPSVPGTTPNIAVIGWPDGDCC